jgi:hypothetical protein
MRPHSFKRKPILCYNIKDFDAQLMTKVYTVKPTDFAAQMKALRGYHTILPTHCTTIYYMTACLQNQS